MSGAPIPILNDVNSSDFLIETVILTSDRVIEPLELKFSVTDIAVFEHMDKPYLTGYITILDSKRLFDRFDFQGAEKIVISIKRTEKSPEYIKIFYIEQIVKGIKVNDTSEVLTFRLVEEILFNSNLQNVNKAFSGKPYDIIKKISNEYLDTLVETVGETDYQKNIKVIVPNMHPIQSMYWIKERATTVDGYPQFLFSTWAKTKLVYADLGTLLEQKPINENIPFMYAMNAGQAPGVNKFFGIQSYSYSKNENLFEMIDQGVIGAKHEFFDTTNNQMYSVDFNINKELSGMVAEKNSRQPTLNVSEDFKFNERSYGQLNSKVITNISSTGAYRIPEGYYSTYGEENDVGGHKKKVIAQALKAMMNKTPIQISVRGREFFSAQESVANHKTIGNIVKIVFLANAPGTNNNNPKIDPYKSGDYLIFSIKHLMQSQRFDSVLTCVKIANYTSDEFPVGTM